MVHYLYVCAFFYKPPNGTHLARTTEVKTSNWKKVFEKISNSVLNIPILYYLQFPAPRQFFILIVYPRVKSSAPSHTHMSLKSLANRLLFLAVYKTRTDANNIVGVRRTSHIFYIICEKYQLQSRYFNCAVTNI